MTDPLPDHQQIEDAFAAPEAIIARLPDQEDFRVKRARANLATAYDYVRDARERHRDAPEE